jgi:hypothetical protein
MQGAPNRRGCRAGTTTATADEVEACGRAPNATYQYDFPWRISIYEFVVSGFRNHACMFKLKRRSFLRPGSIRRRKRRFDTRTNSQKEGQWRHGRRRVSGGGDGQKGRSACRKRWKLIEVTRTLGESVVVSVEYERRYVATRHMSDARQDPCVYLNTGLGVQVYQHELTTPITYP